MQFFSPPRENFFRPLTHDNRELCAAVLRALHERVRKLRMLTVVDCDTSDFL